MTVSGEFEGHRLKGGKVYLSPHEKWIVSHGVDGHVTFRTIGALVCLIALKKVTHVFINMKFCI